MSENRYVARAGAALPFKGTAWHVIDRLTGKDAQGLKGGGYGEQRARELARILNLNAGPRNIPAFEARCGGPHGDHMIFYAACDRPRDRAAPDLAGRVLINGREWECIDVLRGPLPGKPMWIGEPIGLVVRELRAE